MQGDIRKSGLAAMGNVPWGTHFCQLYQTKQDLIDTLVLYFKAGLENNEFCLWVTADNLTAEHACKAMTKVVKDFPAYLKKGQIEILPYDEWYLKGGHFKSKTVLNGLIRKLNQALKKGYAGLRLTDNTFWIEKKDWRSFTDYEETVNNVIGKYKMIALCTYSLKKCGAAEIVDVIRNHAFALIKQEGKWELFKNSRFKAAKEDLVENEKLFRLALKNAPVTVAAQDRNLRFIWAYNQRTIRPEDVLGKTDFDLFSKPDAKKLSTLKNKVMETGKASSKKMWVTSNHKKVYLEIFLEPIHDETGKITGIEVATVDLTREKVMEDALKESTERFKVIASNTPDHIIVQDSDLRYTFVVNPQLGLTEQDMVGKTDYDILKKEDADNLTKIKRQVIKSGKSTSLETSLVNPKGETDYFSGSYVPKFNEKGKVDGLIGYFRNTTERKTAEEELKESWRTLEEAQQIAKLGSWEWNTSTGKLRWSKELYAIYGVEPESFTPTMELFGSFIHPDDRESLNQVMNQLTSGGEAVNVDFRIILHNSSVRYLHATSKVKTYNDKGKPYIYIGTTQDISERKRIENDIFRMNRELQAIRECDQAIVYSTDETVLLTDVCKILCTTAGYRLAWIGSVDHDESKSIRPLVWHGDGNYLTSVNITWADTDRGRGPSGTAARTGKTHFFQDFATEPDAEPWRETALSRGYRSSIAIPLKDSDGNVFAVLSLYSPEPNTFNSDEIRLLEELARDISFGIIALRERVKRHQAELELVHLASFPELNPNPIVELETNGKIVYLNLAAKDAFPDLALSGHKHPFLFEWENLVETIKNHDHQSIIREINVGNNWYLQSVIYVPSTNHYHIYCGNITERRKVEDALKESEESNRLIIETALDGVWTNDLSGRLLYVNAAYCQMIGYTREELLSMYIYDIEAVEKREETNEHINKIIRQGEDQFETRHKRKDGKVIDIEISAKYARTGNGQFIVFARDITARKKAEAELKASEERFKILSEINSLLLNSEQPEKIIQIIADKVMGYLNCDAFFNFIVDESSGRLKLNAYAGIPPEAAAEIEWLDFGTAICGCVARDNQPIVSVNVQENGDERAALVRSYGIKAYASYPLHIGKKITGTVSFGTRSSTSFTYDELSLIEIVADQISVAMRRKQTETELKASEERFSNAFHSSPVALSISRISDGTFVDANRSFLHLFGYNREEIVGQKATELNIYDNPRDRLEIVHQLEQQGRVVNYRVTARTKNGSEIKALTSAEKIELNGQGHINWTTIDITEREQAEDLLRETSNYLNNLLDYANAPIIVWDTHFRISRFNPAFERLTGYKSQEVIGLGLDILFPEDKKAASMHLIRLTLSGERWEVVEIPILRVDGEVRTVLWNSANVYADDGKNIIATVAQGQDITERKRAEEATKISETKYRRLFEAAKDGILLVDAETGLIVDVNPFLVEMLGLPYKEFIGKNLWELGYFKDIVANKDKFIELQQKKYIRYEDLPLRTADGLERKVEFVSNLYEVDHHKIIQCNIRDITARKQAEELLRETSDYLNNLINYANAPIIVWDPQFRITRFNRAFERLTSFNAAEVIGKQLDIFFPEQSKAESMRNINRTMYGERFEAVEIAFQSKDGKEHIILWNSATLFGTDGKTVVATIAQGQDITARKQAEAEVNKLNDILKRRAADLEATNKELETFAYSVSHDLRAPLRSMEGFSQALLEDCYDTLNDACKDYLRRIQASAELMAQLIDDMLQLSRLTRTDMRVSNVNLSEMAQAIAADLERTQPKRKVEFIIAPGIIAEGDEKLLSVVIQNLFENAWKFTGKTAEPRIEFGTTEDNGKVVYFVRDNGAGFDMTYADKLFKPFQRLHTVNEFPGTGIGLASVQRIIQRHSGRVWADAKIGIGANFYFTLGER
jgi:PAS domain S-box-containing protein